MLCLVGSCHALLLLGLVLPQGIIEELPPSRRATAAPHRWGTQFSRQDTAGASIPVDSAQAYLTIARALFLRAQPETAESLYYAGASLARWPTGLAQYRADIAWIATPEELTEFDSTAVSKREEWLRSFWTERDIRDGRRSGERLAEHYRRLFYVVQHYRTVGEETAGPNSAPMMPRYQASAFTPTWVDRFRTLLARTGFLNSDDRAHPQAPELMGSLETGLLEELYARSMSQSLLRAYQNETSVLDDRGIIYLRHGPPDKRATYAGGDADPNESWLYVTPNGPRIFHFTGVIAPTTLVEHLPLNQDLIQSRSGLDPRYGRMAAEVDQNRLTPERVEEERTLERRAIKLATTTDSYPLRFENLLRGVVQAFGLRQGLTGEGRLLVTIALQARDLGDRDPRPGLGANQTRVRVLAHNLQTGVVQRVDTTGTFHLLPAEQGQAILSGDFQLSLPVGRYYVVTVLADLMRRAGAVAHVDDVVVPDLWGPRLTMSNLVLGRRSSEERWIAPPDTVTLNPVNSYPRGSSVEIYYQIGGMLAGHTYETRIEVRNRLDRVKQQGVRATFREETSAARMVQFRTISLGTLPPGEYVLSLTLRDLEGPDLVSRDHLFSVTKH